METTVRNQADAARFVKAQRREILQSVLEQGVMDVINWGNLPTTQKVRRAFASFEKKTLKKLKSNKWTEAEGRGLCMAMEYMGILEDILERAQKQFSDLQEKKKREAK